MDTTEFETLGRNNPISAMAEQYRRGGLDPVKDARTGSAGASEDRVLDRIGPLAKTGCPEMNWQLARQHPKSQFPTFTWNTLYATKTKQATRAVRP